MAAQAAQVRDEAGMQGSIDAALRLQASDALGALHVGLASAVTALGLWLSIDGGVPGWLAGQALVAIALVQWFVLLHEAGHMSLFRTRALNVVAGHVASFFAFIPFAAWRRVHGLHHVWTGWQDRDPTTAALTPRPRGRLQTLAVDAAWRLWLPLFSIVYRLGNYWHMPRLLRLFPARAQRAAIVRDAVLLVAAYGAVAYLAGGAALVCAIGVAVFAGLALQDPLILSQHTHIPQPVSEGRRVEPLSGADQARYTRSLRFPRWFAQWVLINFNAHERHHLHASVPGYRLARLTDPQPNEVDWWTWLRAAKRLRGSQFVFGNREQTGFRL